MSNALTRITVLAFIFSVLLLMGCGAAVGSGTEPIPTATPTVIDPDAILVSTVDELLAAIGNDRVIALADGRYELSSASDYGKFTGDKPYHWNETYDGYELTLEGVSNLKLCGSGAANVTLCTKPRYANVFRCVNGSNICLEGLTVGHTEEPGTCGGGVLAFSDSAKLYVEDCALYGCGTIGLEAICCSEVNVTDTDVYDCSWLALYLLQCQSVRVRDSRIYDMQGAETLIKAVSSDSVSIRGCEIYGNDVQCLLNSGYSTGLSFVNNSVHNNSFHTALLWTERGMIVDGCEFKDNFVASWVHGKGAPVNAAGETLDKAALSDMKRSDVDVPDATPREKPELQFNNGTVYVSTVDELVAAIGSERTIVLDAALYDLSEAADYGGFGNEHYYWSESYDGPELCIVGVHDLTIRSSDGVAKEHTVTAMPRYANVLRFEKCENVTVSGLTLGHTEEPGYCVGGVLYLQSCTDTTVEACRLYGCGTLGIQSSGCDGLNVSGTEIYDCSYGGVELFSTKNVTFELCSLHDLPEPCITLLDCENVSYNGETLSDGGYRLDELKQYTISVTLTDP